MYEKGVTFANFLASFFAGKILSHLFLKTILLTTILFAGKTVEQDQNDHTS